MQGPAPLPHHPQPDTGSSPPCATNLPRRRSEPPQPLPPAVRRCVVLPDFQGVARRPRKSCPTVNPLLLRTTASFLLLCGRECSEMPRQLPPLAQETDTEARHVSPFPHPSIYADRCVGISLHFSTAQQKDASAARDSPSGKIFRAPIHAFEAQGVPTPPYCRGNGWGFTRLRGRCPRRSVTNIGPVLVV